MSVIYGRNGAINEWNIKGEKVLFGCGPAFYIKDRINQHIIHTEYDGEFLSGLCDDVKVSVKIKEDGEKLIYEVKVQNNGTDVFSPEALGLKLGINTYMAEYPKWNDAYFPTLMRCEKTHFWGYFMSPEQKSVIISCKQPVAAWELDYNLLGDEMTADFGHRIYTANLLLLCAGPLPGRHPQNLGKLLPGEEKRWTVEFMTVPKGGDIRKALNDGMNIPVLDAERFTVEKGENAKINIYGREKYTVTAISPSGKIINGETFCCDEYGVYTVKVFFESGMTAEEKIYCRHNYGWYIKNARKNAVEKPQKASTHTESWYGHFSALAAAKHYPDEFYDSAAQANFYEIMTLMYDFEKGEIKIFPDRIQNTSALISLLTDKFEVTGDVKYLDIAAKYADDVIIRQTPDGAYRKCGAHYTAVIYSAKSMLELALCEKRFVSDEKFAERYKKHYASVKAAVDDLVLRLENIGTEGEQTLEDGMLTCSALQISYFALTLPQNVRQKYIDAAEHILACHRCLEQEIIPDCRMRNATLRFWEAQYDVLIRGNMINSPHGWSSWYNYALYYLYLLTGKEEYLRKLNDAMGACLQTIDENGELRWAFIADPYLNLKYFEKDEQSQIADGYKSACVLKEKNHRGKYVQKVFGETYIPMISGWYRAGENSKAMGGYLNCPLILPGGEMIEVDNQGGCCDNDVHEHFKCLEETLLKKAFVYFADDGTLFCISCKCSVCGNIADIELAEDCTILNINTETPITVKIGDRQFNVNKGMQEYIL